MKPKEPPNPDEKSKQASDGPDPQKGASTDNRMSKAKSLKKLMSSNIKIQSRISKKDPSMNPMERYMEKLKERT